MFRMRRPVLIVCVISGALFAAGCKAKSEPPAGEPAKASTATVAAANATPPSTLPAPGSPASRPVLTLGDRLEVERDRKVEGTPKAEDVYAAFEKAGLALSEKKQHVARVFGAQYCLGAKGAGDTAFSVCEYDSPENAATGRETSKKAFEVVPNRELVLNKKTILTVRQPPVKTAESEATSKKAREIFAKL